MSGELKIGEDKLTVTFSYDARAVKLDGFLIGSTLFLRNDCNGFIEIIGENLQGFASHIKKHRTFNTGCIYVQNIQDFTDDFYALHVKYGRGLQFDCHMLPGIIFTSYHYIKGSLRLGGFSAYPLK